MRLQLFINGFQQRYQQHQPFGHYGAEDWREIGNNEQFSGFQKAYIQPIISSFYVPRLIRSIPRRGGAALT
ncbi:hypothetical protein WMW72_01320 [Paenibacillus filicis]|uniref:Uncharacterized protein n=1 Tax=Paenibacillus filicis TaxID=669464 RepID=A0ABU9DCI7_9BACL